MSHSLLSTSFPNTMASRMWRPVASRNVQRLIMRTSLSLSITSTIVFLAAHRESPWVRRRSWNEDFILFLFILKNLLLKWYDRITVRHRRRVKQRQWSTKLCIASMPSALEVTMQMIQTSLISLLSWFFSGDFEGIACLSDDDCVPWNTSCGTSGRCEMTSLETVEFPYFVAIFIKLVFFRLKITSSHVMWRGWLLLLRTIWSIYSWTFPSQQIWYSF